MGDNLSPASHPGSPLELVWRCLSCGQLEPAAANPPQRCPSCGASREEFVLVEED